MSGPATVHTVVLRAARRSRHRARALRSRSPALRVYPDGTALCSLGLVLLFLPAARACLLPLALLARRTLGAPLWLVYGLWLASALGYGLRPVQLAMARLLWPIRRPTAAEGERLDRIWGRVSARAGVRGARFRLRIVDLPEVNAHSVGRDLICVTTGALGELGDRELAGVLAHELGHHLRMHTSAAAYLVWVLLPLQGVALLGTVLAAPAAALAGRLADGRADAHPWASGCARCASRLGHGIRAVFAAPGVAAFAAKNAAGRSAEYRVDAFAVDVGLGPELLSALRWFAVHEARPEVPRPRRAEADGRQARPVRARHAAVRIPRPTHPPLDRRMARIAARVELARPVQPL
jgi:Zn-dependent protease with chaperone function